jgi:hypothetical protein
MRSPGTRRVALAAGFATVAVLALTGCSAGQVAETAMLDAPVSGLNAQSADGSLLIRNLQVLYNDPEGYPAGGNAPLELSLFNQTEQAITVLISSRPPQADAQGIVSARQVGLVSGAAAAEPSSAPEPSVEPSAGASAAPSEPAGPTIEPARITVPALGSATYLPGDEASVQAIGLSDELTPGDAVSLVFELSNGSQPLAVNAPVAIPLTPASRAPGVEGESHE